MKLYDAYEQQERDIVGLRAEIEVLEKEVIDKEIDREGLEQLLSEKDNRVRDLELDHAKATKRIEHLEPELEKMEEKYTERRIDWHVFSKLQKSWTETCVLLLLR